jgi:F0F1-type ATP synthase delta subunit
MVPNENKIVLPNSIVSPTDIARLTREIEMLDNYFREQTIRKAGTANTMPRVSKLMDQLSSDNQINLLQEQDRVGVLQLLKSLHASAPVLHISFSVDPPGAYVQKIVAWLRKNIDQYVLVTVGLQPNIGAGCVVRTTNKIFDFSLREFFAQKRQSFVDKMHEALAVPNSEDNSAIEPTNTQFAAAETGVSDTVMPIPEPVTVQTEVQK